MFDIIKGEYMFGVDVMNENQDKIIFHIDVNSAYLSWSAVKLLQYGGKVDIRNLPAVIGGSEKNRHGIVLAASIPAKQFGIKTGETLYSARQKCRNLKIYPPDYSWYLKSSNALYELLKLYSPFVERYSIDECFMDVTHFKDNYLNIAEEIKNRISKELGFNCNIGISTNKLLAKMASDLKPKNAIHTLFKYEIKDKMWPLPVENLFMVGRATERKLKSLNINTIEELANYDDNILRTKLKSYGKIIKDYANGIDNSQVRKNGNLDIKGIGNSVTIAYDVINEKEAFNILLSLTESVALRLRESKKLCSVVVVSIKTSNFIYYSHQRKIATPTDSTNLIFNEVKKTFREMWNKESIRSLGVRVTDLSNLEYYQGDFFNFKKIEKEVKLDRAIDFIRKKYGNEAIIRSNFLHSGLRPLSGGTGSFYDYPMMRSML